MWTRSLAARDTVALALSRSGMAVELVASREGIGQGLADSAERAAVILGPSFTLEEAEALGSELAAHPQLASLVLIEDLSQPLPCRTLVVDVPTRVLTLPLRIRPLLQAIRPAEDAAQLGTPSPRV